MTTNVTLRVETELLRQARVLAAQRGTSLSRMLSEQLEELVGREAAYEAARGRALARLEQSRDLGWVPAASRGELYER